MSLSKELHRLEQHAYAVMQAMPELREADETLSGFELVKAIEEIGTRYGLTIGV